MTSGIGNKVRGLIKASPDLSDRTIALQAYGGTDARFVHSVQKFRRQVAEQNGERAPAMPTQDDTSHLEPLREALAKAGIECSLRGYVYTSSEDHRLRYCARLRIPGREKEIALVCGADDFAKPSVMAASIRSLQKLIASPPDSLSTYEPTVEHAGNGGWSATEMLIQQIPSSAPSVL